MASYSSRALEVKREMRRAAEDRDDDDEAGEGDGNTRSASSAR
jgi:hypothetical protein